MSKIGPDHFRYRTRLDEDGVSIICERFEVIGETEHFYYVVPWHLVGLSRVADMQRLKTFRKQVHKRSIKRYCYPDKMEAMRSFRARQKWRLSHAQMATSQATLAMAEADRMIEANHTPDCSAPHLCGHDEYTASISWADC